MVSNTTDGDCWYEGLIVDIYNNNKILSEFVVNVLMFFSYNICIFGQY